MDERIIKARMDLTALRCQYVQGLSKIVSDISDVDETPADLPAKVMLGNEMRADIEFLLFRDAELENKK